MLAKEYYMFRQNERGTIVLVFSIKDFQTITFPNTLQNNKLKIEIATNLAVTCFSMD